MYLGLDLGTTNVKAVVVEERGRVLAVGAAPVERFCTSDGGVEQDIEQIWTATQTAIRMAGRGLDPVGIRALGVSSQGGALQLLDPHNKPLGRVISWLDSRGQAFDAALTAELGTEFFTQHVGHGASSLTIGQVLRLRQQSPALLDPRNRIGFVGDVIVGRLCGRRAHDATSLSIAMLYNPWLRRADPDLLARLAISEEQLPRLLPPTAAAGSLQAAAADAIGLPAGIPVSPAIHDQYAASLGAACVGEGDISLGAGTAWVLLANAAELAPPVTPEGYVCQHLIDGLHGQMLSMKNGGSAITWAASLMDRQLLDADQIDQALDAVSPGSKGLRFWPLLSGGPDLDGFRRGGGRLSGITLAHCRNHVLRAVVEGLACELLRHIRLFAAGGVSVGRLAMCGTAAAGRSTPQIIADVTRLPVSCVEASEVSAFGAAMVARKLVDEKTDLADIARQWAPSRRTLHPGDDAVKYNDLRREYLAPFD